MNSSALKACQLLFVIANLKVCILITFLFVIYALLSAYVSSFHAQKRVLNLFLLPHPEIAGLALHLGVHHLILRLMRLNMLIVGAHG